MNIKMLLAYGVCFALTAAHAQTDIESKLLRDTVVLTEDEGLKILYLGYSLKSMVAHPDVDSLVELMLNDIKKAQEQNAYPEETMKTRYFIHSSGRRRLKVENADYPESEFNLEEEIQSINLDLPPFSYIIYDLETRNEIRIYADDPSKIWNLRNMHLNAALSKLQGDKKLLRKHYKVALSRENNQWRISSKSRNSIDAIEIGIIGGVSLMGDRLSPVVSVWPSINLTDKYGKADVKFSVLWSQYARVNSGLSSSEFNNFYLYNSYDFLYMYKISDKSKASTHWLGVSCGFFTTQYNNPELNNALKLGLWMTVGSFVFNWDYVRFRNNGGETLAFTARIGF